MVEDLTPPYAFGAIVRRVIDGDTLEVDSDHGRGIWLHGQVYRLIGNAREKSEPGGPDAMGNLAQLFGMPLLLRSLKPGKDFPADRWGGRWLARITVPGGDLAELLIRSGWMAPWDGHGPKPLPEWPRPAGLPDFTKLLHGG